jgi:hypothetical protein
MAKVRRKKRQVSARTEPMGVPLPTARTGMIGAAIPTAMMGQNPQLTTTPSQTGSLSGVRTTDPQLGGLATRPEGMKNQIESREMETQGIPSAEPAPMPKPKPKSKVKRKSETSSKRPDMQELATSIEAIGWEATKEKYGIK